MREDKCKNPTKIYRLMTYILAVFLLAFSFMGSFSAKAACTLVTDPRYLAPGTVFIPVIPVNPTITHTSGNVAVGAEILRVTAQITPYVSVRIYCNESGTDRTKYYAHARFIGATPVLSSVTSTLGTVYETGIPGIGMTVLFNDVKLGLPIGFPSSTCGGSPTGCSIGSNSLKITLILIKIGEISTNGIDLTQLPKLESFVAGKNVPGGDIVIFQPTFSGMIMFTTPSCALAENSKTVDLGKHKAELFRNSPGTSPWVDASIQLINCNFGGNRPYRYNITGYSNGDPITFTNYQTAAAKWSLTLTPATSIIDNTRGIMAIDSSAGAATGIGIQLVKKVSSPSTTMIDFSTPYTGEIVAGVNQSMAIPLYARYIKTSGPVTAGSANGKLTYTIEYK